MDVDKERLVFVLSRQVGYALPNRFRTFQRSTAIILKNSGS